MDKTDMAQKHAQCIFEESGFFIHSEHAFLGASPDGLVQCECCGEGRGAMK
jgi:hypothetical protein